MEHGSAGRGTEKKGGRAVAVKWSSVLLLEAQTLCYGLVIGVCGKLFGNI